MEFQNYASKQTTSLINELLGMQSGGALQQLKAVRDALDGAARALATPAHLDDSIRDLVAKLTGAADAEVRRIKGEADAALGSLRTELQAQQAETEKSAAALVKADAEIATLRDQLLSTQQRVEATERDLMTSLEAHEALEASRRKLESDWKLTQQAAINAEAELSNAHTTIQQLLADVEQLRSDIEHQTAATASLNAELAQARDAYKQRDAVSAELELSLARVQALEGELSQSRKTQEQLEYDLSASRTTQGQLEAHLSEARKTREQLEAALAQAQIVRDQLDAKLDADAARLETLENELGKVNEIRGQRDALAVELRTASARIRTLEADLARTDKIGEQLEAVAAELDASRSRVRTLETDLVKTNEIREQRDVLSAQLAAANARVQSVESALAKGADGASARLRELEHELTAAREVRDERDRFAVRLESLNSQVHALEKELAAGRDVRDERDRFAIQLEKNSSRLRTLEEELTAARDQLAKRPGATAPAASATGAPNEMADGLRDEVARMASLFDASARAVSELSAVSDSSQLLIELVKRLSLQFSRVALFRLHGDRLVGEHQVGLGKRTDITKQTIATSVDSILTRAITSGAVQSLFGDEAARAGTPFGGSPRSAVAIPITLQGTTLAVVYADDADRPESARSKAVHESGVAFAKLLVGQAVVLLVRHTQELKMLAELSQYATTLIQEAKEMHAADTQAGKNPDLVRSRLKDNIDCASQLYAYRAAMEGTAAAVLLDQQILAELQASTPFARDLAAVMAAMAKNQIDITAEA